MERPSEMKKEMKIISRLLMKVILVERPAFERS